MSAGNSSLSTIRRRKKYRTYLLVQNLVQQVPWSDCEGPRFRNRQRMAVLSPPLRDSLPTPHCPLCWDRKAAGNPVVTV